MIGLWRPWPEDAGVAEDSASPNQEGREIGRSTIKTGAGVRRPREGPGRVGIKF